MNRAPYIMTRANLGSMRRPTAGMHYSGKNLNSMPDPDYLQDRLVAKNKLINVDPTITSTGRESSAGS